MKYGFLVIVPSDGTNTTERDRVHDEFDVFLKDQALGEITKCTYDHSNGNGPIIMLLNNKAAVEEARAFLITLKSPGTKAQWEQISSSQMVEPAGDPGFPGLRRIPH